MKILVTGVAGFIGMHSAKKLLDDGHEIIGIDNLNDYYDVTLKKDRLKTLEGFKNFKFLKLDIKNAISCMTGCRIRMMCIKVYVGCSRLK